jgi:hypothetical protein
MPNTCAGAVVTAVAFVVAVAALCVLAQQTDWKCEMLNNIVTIDSSSTFATGVVAYVELRPGCTVSVRDISFSGTDAGLRLTGNATNAAITVRNVECSQVAKCVDLNFSGGSASLSITISGVRANFSGAAASSQQLNVAAVFLSRLATTGLIDISGVAMSAEDANNARSIVAAVFFGTPDDDNSATWRLGPVNVSGCSLTLGAGFAVQGRLLATTVLFAKGTASTGAPGGASTISISGSVLCADAVQLWMPPNTSATVRLGVVTFLGSGAVLGQGFVALAASNLSTSASVQRQSASSSSLRLHVFVANVHMVKDGGGTYAIGSASLSLSLRGSRVAASVAGNASGAVSVALLEARDYQMLTAQSLDVNSSSVAAGTVAAPNGKLFVTAVRLDSAPLRIRRLAVADVAVTANNVTVASANTASCSVLSLGGDTMIDADHELPMVSFARVSVACAVTSMSTAHVHALHFAENFVARFAGSGDNATRFVFSDARVTANVTVTDARDDAIGAASALYFETGSENVSSVTIDAVHVVARIATRTGKAYAAVLLIGNTFNGA